MDPQETAAATAEAVLATDDEGRIVGWNRRAETLLGYDSAQVLGKRCYETFRGTDVFGNRFCDRSCPIRNMIRRQEPLRYCKLCLQKADGSWLQAWLFVIVLPGSTPRDYVALHLIEPVEGFGDRKGDGHRFAEDRRVAHFSALSPSSPNNGDPPARLTPRELEVLQMLDDGSSTNLIAERLFISITTVRNHVHHILRKLAAQSRIEAVSLARRKHLL